MRSFCLLALLALVAASPLAAQTAISFEPAAVVASGMSPGGQVAWFSVARESEDHAAKIVRREPVVTDDNGDGAVRLELGKEVPLVSIWVAVDLATGKAVIATPEGFPLRQIELPGAGSVSDGVGPNRLELSRGYLELLVVRPGIGVWGATVGDGGEKDDDGASDSKVSVELVHLRASATSPAAPLSLGPGDVIVVIDPNEMEVAVSELAPSAVATSGVAR
jgi:hypothetical protein